MPEKTIIVKCEYTHEGKPISAILQESFVFFLNRTFANPKKNH